MKHLWQIGQTKRATLVLAALRIPLLAGQGLFLNRLMIAASVTLLLGLICPPCRADFVWQDGSSSVIVPYNGTHDFPTPLGSQTNIPPEINQSFSDPAIGSTITGQVIAGTAATPDGWYVALSFSNTYSVSGSFANENIYGPQPVDEEIAASGNTVNTATYQSTTCAVSLRGSGYLAPGDTIEYELQGLFYSFEAGNKTLELDISGTITASGDYTIDLAKSIGTGPIYPGDVDIAFGFYFDVFKGGGGGTTTFTADPGITLSGPEPATATPEPSSFSLLGIGSGGLLGLAWRSRRRGNGQAGRLEPVM